MTLDNEVWNLDLYNPDNNECKDYMKTKGYDKGTHSKFRVGDIVQFMTGYNDDILAQASIKGLDGDCIYVYNDCFWFAIKDTEQYKITKIER